MKLCNECFIKMWRQRLLSPFLPNSTFTSYLLDSYKLIQQNCFTSLPVTTSSSTLFVSLSTATATSTSGLNTVSTTSGAPATTTCAGQLIQPPSSGIAFCQNLADQYNVTTGDVMEATGDLMCGFTSPICLPLPCNGEVIYDGQSWYVKQIFMSRQRSNPRLIAINLPPSIQTRPITSLP